MDKDFQKFLKLLVFPFCLVAAIWSVELIEFFGSYRFVRFGIFPRDAGTLTGIITAPFIHSDWGHLISNTFPLFALSTIMVVFYKRLLIPVYSGIWILTGVAVWLFARGSYHIGISGIVYGLIGFIFWSGLFRENIRAIILSLVILIAYSGYFQGLTPEEGVSWESHLFGAISGAFMAFFLKGMKASDDEEEVSKAPSIPEEKRRFFSPNTFLFTKEERRIRALLDDEE